MPAGTPPEKVLAAVKNFAREEFGLKHRYAMVLHTDEPHPHVHMVLKAVSEQSKRLHIRKATLGEWRRGFARHLRALGVEANATERAVRGETTPRKTDAIYRATLRGESTHMRDRTELVARELETGTLRVEPGKTILVETRKEVERGWRAVSDILRRDGQNALSEQVRRFVEQMPQSVTERQFLATELLRRATNQREAEKTLIR
jgi:hypothetical protein